MRGLASLWVLTMHPVHGTLVEVAQNKGARIGEEKMPMAPAPEVQTLEDEALGDRLLSLT